MRYRHGGDLYGREALIDFSENINPLGLPLSVQNALSSSVCAFGFYPDPFCRDLTAFLSQHLNISPERILFGNGAADLIYRVVLALHPKSGLLLAPTFGEYAQALEAAGAAVLPHFLLEKDAFQLTKQILDQITPAIGIVILCNPNNPTGQLIPRSLILQIAEKCAKYDIPVLLDECFMPFVEEPEAFSLLHKLDKFPNVLLLGAFTKLYAMAGIRLGYLICADPKRRAAIDRYAPPWNISTPAQVAGVAALCDQEYLQRSLTLVQRERGRLWSALTLLDMKLYGSKADYLFFRCPYPQFAERMEALGILVRECNNYEGLEPGYYRIGIKTVEKNNLLLDAIRKIKEGND